VSRKLNLDDLAGLIGMPPDGAPGEMAAARPKTKARTAARDPTVLPADPVDLTALRTVDARLRYLGKRVMTLLPIDDVRIRVRLADSRLKLKPINFGVGGGNITSRVTIDASEPPVPVELQTEISQVDLKEILRRFDIADASVGDIGGRAKLKAVGDSVAELAAPVKGRLSLIMAGGRIDSLLVQLAGIDVTELIVALVGSDEAVPIRCTFTDFRARNGQVDVLTMLVDTTDTRFSGNGSINLDDERGDLVLTPDPKDFSLFAFPAPLHIAGRFSNPAVYHDYSELRTPTTVTVLLGLVATPLAALIPLIETESGEDAACKALLDTAREERRTALQVAHQRPHSTVQFMRQGQ
jgi:uncharacterized protein involved in outer membrane biogenesis